MKTSALLASWLAGSLALAAPLERRARLTKTEVVTTTVYSTVTVYDDDLPLPTTSATATYAAVAAATTTAITTKVATSSPLFYEKPSRPTSAAPYSTPVAPVYTPLAPSSSAAPAPVSYSVPAIVSSSPAPVAYTPAPVVASPSPQPSVGSSSSSGSAEHTNVDLTMYNGYGGKGACGTTLNDSDIFVALSQGVFGPSTYNVMTGEATDPWCKATVEIFYNGKSVRAPVVDRCAGCAGTYDVDLSPAAYSALGLDASAPGRFKASWSKVS